MESGTCEVFAGAYLVSCRSDTRRGPRPQRTARQAVRTSHEGRLALLPRARQSLILIHGRTGEASRVLHPSRSGASGCRANGRSATRPESQRSRRRTRWDGHPAWGSKPRPLCLPSRAVQQPTMATGRRTAAAMPRPRDSHRAERPCSHDCTGVPFIYFRLPLMAGIGAAAGASWPARTHAPPG